MLLRGSVVAVVAGASVDCDSSVWPAAVRVHEVEPSVVVVGSVNVDLVVLVERLPVAGETVTGGTFARYGGGKGANQAVAAARAGADVLFVGAVGDDALGAEALADLEADGIDVSRVAKLEGETTGTALVVVDAHGENQIAVAPGANARLGAQTAMAALEDVVTSGTVLLVNLEIANEAILASATRVVDAGGSFVLNPAPAREIDRAMFALGPVLVPNAGESIALTGARSPDAAARELARITSAPVIVTLGAAGALVATDEGVVEHPAFEVDVIDTTGAGDAFCGTLAAELARVASLDEAVRRAMAAAALTVTAMGARTSPDREAVDDFLRSRT